MANVTAGMVKELRERTGAGMMDCKKALTEANGDMEAAIDWLRKKGLSAAPMSTPMPPCAREMPSMAARAIRSQ